MATDEKIVLITGANRGIGFQTALSLARKGFHVVLSARTEKKAEEAAKRIVDTSEAGQTTVSCLALDVAEPESIRSAALEFGEKFPHLDVLVNNAGIYPDDDRSILDVTAEDLWETLRVNTAGPLLVSRACWPFLEKAPHGGRIINLSSGLGQLIEMETDAPTYSISKTALNAITRQLAAIGHDHRISVNSVCPGWVRTDMGGSSAPRSVEEGADTVIWLAGEAPADLSGKFLRDRKQIAW